MLRVVSDREVAKDAARVNLSALLLGEPRIVTPEGRFRIEELGNAIARSGEDLGAIRRAVSSLIAPEVSRLSPPRVRRPGRER